MTIYETVAGVLHFGNVKFKVEKRANQEDTCSINSLDSLQHACKLWGINADLVSKSLTSRNIGTREVVVVTYNQAQAQV